MKIFWAAEFGLALILGIVYQFRPDPFAALTVLPAWSWLLLALPMVFGWRRANRRWTTLATAAWLLFAVVHAEELSSLARGWFQPIEDDKPTGALRVVTLNCGGGHADALAETLPLKPDVLLLQEPPSRPETELFCKRLFGAAGETRYDMDTAILIRGNLTDVRRSDSRIFFSHARADMVGFGPVDLVSLRLDTGHVQLNLWNPDCWRTHYRWRLRQLAQIREIAAELPVQTPLLVAGDFNAPQQDRIFSLLPTGMQDAFAIAGKGIGNTILNEIPVLRIDQIWVSSHFQVVQSFARRTQASDHRLVVADLVLAAVPPPPAR